MVSNERKIARSIFAGGGTLAEAVEAVYEYMREKDSLVSRRWCEHFALRVAAMMRNEGKDDAAED